MLHLFFPGSEHEQSVYIIITVLTIKLKFKVTYLRFLITYGIGGHIAKKIILKKLKNKLILRFLITHGIGCHIAKKIIHKKLKRKKTQEIKCHILAVMV